ncbi:MAG: ShlB/FhaC/HecB family hemolysin secretion/activation protein [Pseudomonadota bacterium]
MRNPFSGYFMCMLLGAQLASAAALAQAPQPNIPGTVDPGRLQERFEAPKLPRAVNEPLIPDDEKKLPPEEADKIRFTLSAITLRGNTIFPDAALSNLYKEHLGKEITLGVIYQIADAITAKYRNAGYVLARATVPAQRVENGIVQIVIFEGQIGKASIEGKLPGKGKLLEAYLNKITESTPLSADVLERYVLLMNDLPGVTAKAVLVPSFDTAGATDLVLQVSEDPWDAAISVDNRGTEFIGAVQFRAQGGYNNLLGLYERISAQSVVTQNTNELRFFDFGYAQPVGTEGTVAGISANISYSNPGSTLKPFDIEGQNRSITATLSHPWVRSRRQNISFQGSFTAKNSRTDLRSSLLTEDRLRVVRAGASADFTDRFAGVNLFGLEVSQGLDILHATNSGDLNRTRFSGREDFTKFTGNAMRIQSITQRTRAVFAMNGQYALSQLFSSEEFGYGGVPFGHAYDPSQLTGDHGVSARAEGQYTTPYQNDFLRSSELYAFYDIGSVWHIENNARPWKESAASLGGGARFTLSDKLIGYVEIAKPLTTSVPARGSEGKSPRFFFSLTAPL